LRTRPIPTVTLYHGDCRDIAPTLSGIDAVISDPPYGCANNCDYTRFTGGLIPKGGTFYRSIKGDDQPFDPTPWLEYPKVVLFGCQFYADKLPQGTVLVWNKRRPNQLGKFLSDAELAWMKGGKGCYLFNHIWNGFDRESERGKSLHPTQKPIALWDWVLTRAKIHPGQTVLDPYMGSGSLGLACVKRGINYIGIEIERDYFRIAQQRLAA
jgi:DNA modification methylase